MAWEPALDADALHPTAKSTFGTAVAFATAAASPHPESEAFGPGIPPVSIDALTLERLSASFGSGPIDPPDAVDAKAAQLFRLKSTPMIPFRCADINHNQNCR